MQINFSKWALREIFLSYSEADLELLQHLRESATVINPISLFLYCNFPKISKKLLLKTIKKAWWIWNYPLTMVPLPKATVWNDSGKINFVKIHVLKKASVAKIYNSLRRYFAKLREIVLFYLTAESKILQSCFCRQTY